MEPALDSGHDEDCTELGDTMKTALGLGTQWRLHRTRGHDEVCQADLAPAEDYWSFCRYPGEFSLGFS
jgi:hypothetical protein